MSLRAEQAGRAGARAFRRAAAVAALAALAFALPGLAAPGAWAQGVPHNGPLFEGLGVAARQLGALAESRVASLEGRCAPEERRHVHSALVTAAREHEAVLRWLRPFSAAPTQKSWQQLGRHILKAVSALRDVERRLATGDEQPPPEFLYARFTGALNEKRFVYQDVRYVQKDLPPEALARFRDTLADEQARLEALQARLEADPGGACPRKQGSAATQ